MSFILYVLAIIFVGYNCYKIGHINGFYDGWVYGTNQAIDYFNRGKK